MQQALRGMGEFCSVYVDDNIVFSQTAEDNIGHLEQVFSRLREVGLRLHPAKCRFAQVAFLGHLITAQGILPNPDKIKALKEFRNPTNAREVQEFLKIAEYYRRFVPGFSKVAGPLHNLTMQSMQFQWTPESQESFDRLKELLSARMLVAKAWGLEVEGHLQPIAYASRTLSNSEKNYGITDLEALGVVWALRHFRAYLLGHQCTVVTDHGPLKAMLKARHSSGKLARWSQTITEMDVDIVYCPGRKHGNADTLSKSPLEHPVPSEEVEVNQVGEAEQSELVKAQREDPWLRSSVEYMEQGTLPSEEKDARKVVY